APKSKATKKKTVSESSPKTKPSPTSKGKRIKTSAKGDKPATTKSKGLTVLSEVALFKAEQMKSGTNEGVGDKPKVPDVPKYRLESEEESWKFSQREEEDEDDDEHNNNEDDEEHDSDDDNDDNDDEDDGQENDSQRTESDDEGDDFVYLNLSTYIADGQEKEKEEQKADDDDDDDDDGVASDQKVSTPPDYELTEEDENQEDDDNIGEDQEDEENGELYGDLNLNLGRQDAEMTDAQTNQETEEAHVTLTTEPLVVQQQSSYFSSDLVAKFTNPSPDTESDMSELKQTNQFAKALSSIPGIVDKYLKTKVKDTVDVAIQLKSDKLREEAQEENQYFLNSLESNVKRIIKEQVKAQTSKIMTKVKKYVTETLGAEVLVRSTNQPQTSYANLYRALLEAYNSNKDLLSSYGEVVTLKRGRDDQNKDEEPFAGSNRGSKRQRSGKEVSSKEATQKKSKSTCSFKCTTRSPPKSSGKSVQEEEHDPRVDDLEEPFHQEFDTGNDDVSPVREATDV
ncbi:hypothetical protein Tco_1409716, partial [Tanacetum coccineum]